MDPTLAVSVLLARHKADVALAVAAKMMDMNPKAAERVLEAFHESADDLERIAADVAAGTGEVLDISV
ncbi:hypothetical protein [Microbaculum marinisediminis]|uniref:ANTAR domain-containing protein n=1 Tax=Microbaculum marinisediminis TaxID=2931392 RepID=A0AAW5R7A9_9HYPH|nr:hypothetical protein [Microbaculum sp. A6E488]MCT8974524.1 hypothetical protein [Microbaculum sp. A6E488]